MIRQEIKERLNQGIIEPLVSKWALPTEWALPILKIDGSLRLCVDYQHLTTISQTISYPMLKIDDLLKQLGQAHFLSTLNLTCRYWQVATDDQNSLP